MIFVLVSLFCVSLALLRVGRTNLEVDSVIIWSATGLIWTLVGIRNFHMYPFNILVFLNVILIIILLVKIIYRLGNGD